MAGTFTYAGTAAGTITTARDQVRLLLGDTNASAVLFYDAEIDVYLVNRGSAAKGIILATADLCESAANRFARAYDLETDGQRLWRSQQAEAFRVQAGELRKRAHGVSTIEVKRIDGYSDDVGNQDVGETSDTNLRLVFRRSSSPDDIPS